MVISSARVSTGEQTLDPHLDALTKAGCGTITRKESGSNEEGRHGNGQH